MERHANYALVGALSLLLLIGGLIFVVWLAQVSFNETYDRYRINFRGPVSGLSKGGEVQFNGIKVGEITRLELDRRDPNLVVTDILVQSDTPVRVDSEAQTSQLGITGVKYVQISPGTPSRPLLREVSNDDPPVILAGRSRLENFVQDASSLMSDGAQALARINRLLSDQNLMTMSAALGDVGAVTAELRARRTMFARLDSTFAKFDRAAGDLELAVRSARLALGGEGSGALGEMGAAAAEMRGAVSDIRTLVTRVDGSVGQLSATTLPEMNAAMGSIQEAAGALDQLATDIRRDPRGALTRPAAREVEIAR
jgi:phospholipid/cholesterol/gamma-HCH transport system substrate-binding protein